MKHLILRWSATLAITGSLALMGCSKADEAKSEDSASAVPAEASTATGAGPEAPTGAAQGGEGSGADGKGGPASASERHAKQVENAKKAIPTVASDDQTNAAIAATAKVDKADVATAKNDLAATAKAVPAAKSTVADTDTYSVVVDAPTGAAGKKGTVTVYVKPKPGWKLNMEFPTKLKIEPPAGVKVAKSSLKKGDAKVFSEKKGATWAVGYTSATAGKKQFSGKLKFAVCTDATCDPKSATLAFAVDVK